jgi:HEAT repeat protein
MDEAIAAFFSAAKANKLEDFQRAEEWLVMQGDKAIEPLGSILNNEQGDMTQRIAVCRPLRRLGPPAKPPLKQALTSSSRQLQLNAMAALGILKPTDDDIIQTLVAYLDDKEERVRREAILALANVGPPAKDACTDKLLAILNNMKENETLRDAAKLALKHVNPRRTFND